MNAVVITGYLCAAAAFLIFTLLLAASWRGQRIGGVLLVAAATSALWGAFLAYAAWRGTLAISWIFAADTLRYGAWLGFLTALFGPWRRSTPLRGLRAIAHALWIALALYCLWPMARLLGFTTQPFYVSVPIVGMLVLALLALVLLEQLYRNVVREQRWALKFLVVGLGLIFAYDIFMYSFAALYGHIDQSVWAARGFINVLMVPLLMIAAARNSHWSVPLAISRRVVFYSTSLFAVALYIIATAMGGYFVHLYGGNWGRVAEITLICLSFVMLLLLIFSGQARSRFRLFLFKNFFNFRHDYREEWLKLTSMLSTGEAELPLHAIQALAGIMDSPGGALFMRDDANQFVLLEQWNMPVMPGLKLPANLPAFDFMQQRQWIYDFSDSATQAGVPPAVPDELSTLPRAWLLVPLTLDSGLIGFAVLGHARARRKLDWEEIDLLRAAGHQVASTLAQSENARRLAEARQFEGFNRLTAFMMHDLKNLAAQQSLLLKNAEKHKTNPAFIDDMLATIEGSVRRTNRILEQLRGDAAGVRTRVRLAAVIERALSECAGQSPEPVCYLVQDDLYVQADADQLATILGHIIRNAQDAVHGTGRVEVRLRRDDAHAIVEIEDNGEGMTEEFIRNQLFKPFFTTKASKGMGIGAYQAREYVRSIGGQLKVVSDRGNGTRITVVLPLDLTAGSGSAARAKVVS